jgi:hypothetical protein
LGGGAAPFYVRHTFDGKTYQEAERVPVGEVPPEGLRLLAGELGSKLGAPLMPHECRGNVAAVLRPWFFTADTIFSLVRSA